MFKITKRIKFTCRLALLTAMMTMSFFQAAYALEINAVRLGHTADKNRLVIETDKAEQFRTFLLDNPYRLVIDLPSFTWNAGEVSNKKQFGITDIRHGVLQDSFSRIVFDLKTASVIKNAFAIKKTAENNDKIVIDFAPASEKTFLSQKNKIFGRLSIPHETETTQPKYIFTPQIETPQTASEPTPGNNQAKNIPRNEYKPMIVIDPGHGGVDPGAVGSNNTYEKDVVLSVASELKKALLATGRYRVTLTREKDVFIKLKDRVSFARDHQADLFISVHADSTPHTDTRGTSIYTLSQKASDEQTAKLAEQENKADLIGGINLQTEDEQVAYILGDFLMTDTMNQSKFFANTLVKTLKNSGIKIVQNTHRYAGFAVLKAPDIPSVLIEAGFMSNPKEAELLNQLPHKQKIAKAVLKGINAYFEHVQQNEIGD